MGIQNNPTLNRLKPTACPSQSKSLPHSSFILPAYSNFSSRNQTRFPIAESLSRHCGWTIATTIAPQGRSRIPEPTMTANHRHTKRKASPEEEEATARPQRKKQKQRLSQGKENSLEPSVSPTAMKRRDSSSGLQKHLMGLYDEIVKAADDEYDPFFPSMCVFVVVFCVGLRIC
jgi:hypothetical protein